MLSFPKLSIKVFFLWKCYIKLWTGSTECLYWLMIVLQSNLQKLINYSLLKEIISFYMKSFNFHRSCFLKLENYLLNISTKSIVLPEKPIYWDILILNSKSGDKTFVHCSSKYQASHFDYHRLIFAVEILKRFIILPLNLLQKLILGIYQQSMLKTSVLPNQE